MNANEQATVKRVIETLKLNSKTHFSRQDIDRIVKELEMLREYQVADSVRSMDPASVTALLR